MTAEGGVGVTEIGHDSEAKTRVKGYESPGSYRRKITYDIPKESIKKFIAQSKHCDQFIKYKCYKSMICDGWWVSREGCNMYYWNGASTCNGRCNGECNCDKNDSTWREDSGRLTDKDVLPVSELRFGDTGGNGEEGYHTLGKLRCWG